MLAIPNSLGDITLLIIGIIIMPTIKDITFAIVFIKAVLIVRRLSLTFDIPVPIITPI